MKRTTIVLGLVLSVACYSGCEEPDSDATEFQPISPVAEIRIDTPEDDPTLRNAGQPDVAGDAIRKRSIALLSKAGFTTSPSLPTAGHRRDVPGKLRPTRDVAQRLMALNALFMWASAPESAVATADLKAYIQRNKLRNYLAPDEAAIISLSRSKATQQHASSVGWRLENMWALAWVLGFDTAPDPTLGQIPGDITRSVVMDFIPGLETSVDDLIRKANPRSLKEIIELEDVFYCSHNAVRSAQTGAKTVPSGFHPARDGGAIHERRHALTWTISPDAKWDDTDLST